jgi:hypothetical protein
MLQLTACWRGGYAGRAGYWLEFAVSHDGHFLDGIAALKAAVPFTDRAYDPVTRRWWISADYAPTLTPLIRGLEGYLAQRELPW